MVISCKAGDVEAVQDFFELLKIPCRRIGEVGGDRVRINDLIDSDVKTLSDAYYHSMPGFIEKVV